MAPTRVQRTRDLFTYRCVDAQGAAEARKRLLPAHLAYVEAHFDAYAVAGPILDASGVIVGSLFVLDVADQATAELIMIGDPYCAGGVYASMEAAVFRAAAGRWIGGVIW